MTIHILAVPYDSGHRARRMGAGPLRILERGRVSDRLRATGGDVSVAVIEHDLEFPTEIGTAFGLHRALARKVSESLAHNALPLVLSGNCNSSLGTVAGLQRADQEPLGVIWFDGHGDCNTPETFTGDFLDAMGLSTLTGLCWQALAASIPGFQPVRGHNVLLVGGHGMDQGARQVLAASPMAHAPTAEIKARGSKPRWNRISGGLGRRGSNVSTFTSMWMCSMRIMHPPMNSPPGEGSCPPIS